MNEHMLIRPGDKLEVVMQRNADGTKNDGSIVALRGPGHAYCIAKAPRYASDEEWKHNADLIAAALRQYGAER